jgi:hypothetical protein
MPKRSQAWKDLERDTAAALKGRRIIRFDLFQPPSADIAIDDMPELSLDSKHRARWQFHSLLKDVQTKYGGIPLLITKSRGERGAVVSCPLDYFAGLLAEVRAYRNIRGEIACRIQANKEELANAEKQRALIADMTGADKARAEWDKLICQLEAHIACLHGLKDIVVENGNKERNNV